MAALSHPGVDPSPSTRLVVVDLWVVSPDAGAPAVHLRLLDDAERARAADLPASAAPGFVLGRALLRHVLAQRLGCTPHEVQLRATCPACGGPHGPVAVTGPVRASVTDRRPLHVSLTRSGPVVAVAVCEDGVVGVDAERLAAVRASSVADVVLSPGELARHRRWPAAVATRRLARAWVRKEAALKALGTGLVVAPETVELHRPPRTARGVDAVAGSAVAVANVRMTRASAGAVAVVAPGLVAGPVPGPTRRRRALVVRRYDGARLLAGRR